MGSPFASGSARAKDPKLRLSCPILRSGASALDSVHPHRPVAVELARVGGRRDAEMPFEVAAEVRGADVSHAPGDFGGTSTLGEDQLARPLQAHVAQVLDRR